MPNPYHDKLGRFATKSGAGGAMSGDAAAKRQAARARTAASVAVLDRSVAEQFDPRAVDSITATYGRLADKYPDVPVRTITVGDAGSMSARCCARFDENGRKVFDIVLDPTMADYTKTVKEFSDSASNGYHPPCDDAYRGIITHEFGHAVAGAKGDEEALYTRGEKLVTGMRSAQAPGFIRGVSASTTCRSDQYNGSQYQSGPGGATNTGILGLTNRKGLANGECYADRSPVQLSDLPHCWPASLVGESVRVRAGGVQRLHSGEAGSLRCRGQDQRQRRTEAGHHCGEENTGTCLAVGIVQCCPTAGNTRRDVGILQLLQVDYRQAQGPQGGCAQVSVPQGQPTVDSVYPQWVQPAIQREAVCGEDRGTESRLVAESPVRTVIGDDHQRRCRSLLRIVCGATGRPATTRVGHRDWDRPGTDHVRSVVERQDHRIAEVLPTRRTAAEEGATGFVPQGQGQQEQGQATHQGCEGSRQGAGHPAGLGAQALDADHPREPSGVRRGLVRCRPGAYPHGEVGPRCRVVTVHPHVGGEGQPFWPNLRAGGSVVPVIANVQCVRCGGREEGTQRQGVDVPVRYNPRPGFERGQERTRGGTRRESKRLRRAGKSPRLAGSVAL